MAITHLFYPSVAALRASVEAPFEHHANKALVDKHLTDSRTREDWHGIAGGAPAVLRCLTDGYADGERDMRAFHASIAVKLPRAIGINRTRVNGAMGDELDIHAVNRGTVDRAWSSSQRRLRKGNSALRLVIDICANGSTEASALRWCGIAGLSLAEVMSKAGYSVEIVAAMGVNEHACRHQMTMSTVVKARNATPDYGLLAATVCLPGFFRTLGFASIVRAADDVGSVCYSGLGNYLDVSGVLPVPERVTQIIVPGSIRTEKTATEWVNDTVRLLQGATS